MKLIKLILLSAVIAQFFISISHAEGQICTKYCNPAKSTPCGNACIAIGSNCHKDWTTACVGIKPASAKGAFKPSEIKHVNKTPTNK